MDISTVLAFLQDSIYWIAVFGACLVYGMVRARRSLVNLILGLYFGLLISLKFPYYDQIVTNSPLGGAATRIILFALFTAAGTFVMGKLMRCDYDEPPFYDVGKKAALALLASILIMIFSFHVLPVTEFVTPGSLIQALFAPAEWFFWWLLVPIAGLLFL